MAISGLLAVSNSLVSCQMNEYSARVKGKDIVIVNIRDDADTPRRHADLIAFANLA